jgi:UDP-glucose 4-epimerase
MKQTVVITGATGFIGSALLDALIKADHQVIGLTRRPPEEGSRLLQVSSYPDYDPPENAVLVHLAERRDVKAAEERGDDYIGETVTLTRLLLEKPWNHAIYASSGEVYGDGINTERRTDEPVVPRGMYAITKFACEKEILNAGGTVLRLGNVYGKGMSPYNVLSDILKQIPGEGPLWVNDTTPMRDFVWIGDVVAGFIAAVNLKKDGVFNIASGRGTSIGELARQMLEVAGEGDRPVKARFSAGRGSCIVLDIAESRKQLGWVPAVPLRKGLELLLNDHDE